MTMTGLESFDTTVQKTDVWLKEIMHGLGWDDRRLAYSALRSVLHTLRDRLTVDEAASMAAQLPMLIRGLYYDTWDPSSVPQRYRSKEQFLQQVHQRFGPNVDVDPEQMTRVVFNAINAHLTEGEVEKVRSILPDDILHLWPT